jgi:hypothetical protein
MHVDDGLADTRAYIDGDNVADIATNSKEITVGSWATNAKMKLVAVWMGNSSIQKLLFFPAKLFRMLSSVVKPLSRDLRYLRLLKVDHHEAFPCTRPSCHCHTCYFM